MSEYRKDSMYRLIALNALCPACKRIIEFRKEHPNLDIKYPNSFFLYQGSAMNLLRHSSHVHIVWKGRTGTIVSGERVPR